MKGGESEDIYIYKRRLGKGIGEGSAVIAPLCSACLNHPAADGAISEERGEYNEGRNR